MTIVLIMAIVLAIILILGLIKEMDGLKKQIDTLEKLEEMSAEMHDLIDSRKKVTELEGRIILLENSITYVVKNNDEIRRAVNHLLEKENDGNFEEGTGTDVRIQDDMD